MGRLKQFMIEQDENIANGRKEAWIKNQLDYKGINQEDINRDSDDWYDIEREFEDEFYSLHGYPYGSEHQIDIENTKYIYNKDDFHGMREGGTVLNKDEYSIAEYESRSLRLEPIAEKIKPHISEHFVLYDYKGSIETNSKKVESLLNGLYPGGMVQTEDGDHLSIFYNDSIQPNNNLSQKIEQNSSKNNTFIFELDTQEIIQKIEDINPLFIGFVDVIENEGHSIQDHLNLVPIEEHLTSLKNSLENPNELDEDFFLTQENIFNRNKEIFDEIRHLDIAKISDVDSITNAMAIKYAEVRNLILNPSTTSRKRDTSVKKIESNIGKGITNKIFDKHQKPVLNIESVANVFSKYIINYNSEYTSTIIGIFAKWGRGKTFFYELLKSEIEKKDKRIYFCKFQPWKYQKPESAWAYLYETILNNYLDNNNIENTKKINQYESKLRKIFSNVSFINKLINKLINYIEPQRIYKIYLLNKNRIGIGKFLLGVFSLFLLLIWIFLPFENKFNTVSWITGAIGLSGLILFYKSYNFYIKSKGAVSDLINNYGKTKDYSNYLGFQNEIEKELRYLINTYIHHEKEQLILFIDDLDRCNEKMIISIMDSLRLVLEDDSINKKLTIITAVDERILLKSIKHKYFDNENSTQQYNEVSPSEYIEKFFLIALKLNHLSDQDKIELVNEYTNLFNDNDLENTKDLSFKYDGQLDNNKNSNKKEYFGSEKTLKSDIKVDDLVEKNDNQNLVVLSSQEIEFIKDLLVKSNIDTPRKINMLVQRYLLFKNFIFEEFGEKKEFDSKLLISLIFEVLDQQKLQKLIEKYSKSNELKIEFELDENNFEVDKDVFIILLKYAEMVSPF